MARSLVTGFLSIFSSRIAVIFITFLSTPVITRTLGTSGYGDFQTVTAIFSMLMIFVSSGIGEGVQKFTGQRSTTDWRSNVISFYLRVALTVAVIVGVGVLAFTSLGLVEVFVGNGGFAVYFYLLAVLVLAAQLREYTRRTLMGLNLEHYSEPLVVANTLVWVVIGLGLAHFWASNTTEQVMSLLIGQILAGFTVAAVGFPVIASRIDISRLFDRTPSNYPVREFLSFNVMTILLLFLVTSLYKVDVILIKTFIGSSRAGIYSAALALAEYLWFIPTSLQILFIHSTSDLWEKRRISLINDMASRATRYTALVVMLMALGIAALANHFVPLYYGESYVEAVQPLYVLLPGAVAFAIARPMFSIGQGNGNLRPLIVATGIAAGLNLVLNLLLIPRFGIMGAAFSTSLGYASMLAMHTWSARHIGFNPIGDLRAARIVATVVLSAIPIFGLAGLIQSTVTAMIVVPIVGATVYTLIAIATGALDVDEILEIFASFPEPIGSRATLLRREVSGQNLLNTNMMSKLLTGAGILLLAVGLVLSVGTLFSGQDGGPDVVTNGTQTETQTPNTAAAGGTQTSPSDDGSGATATPGDRTETTGPGSGTEAPPDTETPGAQTPNQTQTQTQTPPTQTRTQTPPAQTPNQTQTPPTQTRTQTPPGGNNTTGPGTTTPNGTQAPGGGQGPNTGTGTPPAPGGSPTPDDADDDDLIVDFPGGDDDNDAGTPNDTPGNATAPGGGPQTGSPNDTPGPQTTTNSPTTGGGNQPTVGTTTGGGNQQTPGTTTGGANRSTNGGPNATTSSLEPSTVSPSTTTTTFGASPSTAGTTQTSPGSPSASPAGPAENTTSTGTSATTPGGPSPSAGNATSPTDGANETSVDG